MFQLPVLPEGYVAQPVWLKEHCGDHYEFAHVYDPTGRLDRGRSYWMVLARGPAERAEVRYVTWSGLWNALGRKAPRFPTFSSYETPPAQIEEWLQGAGTAPPERREEPAAGGPAFEPLPWKYYGLCLAGSDWVRVSGYVPCEGRDTEGGARAAADMLEADAVILESERHKVISVRGADGTPIALPFDATAEAWRGET